MPSRQWYTALGGKQDGPFSDERLREMIASGVVRADTLVWSDGMSNWAKAAEIPGLIPAPGRFAPAAAAPASAVMAARPAGPVGTAPTHAVAAHDTLPRDDERRLAFDPVRNFDRVWPLYWRVLVLGLCQIVVIPLPWMATSFIRWFVAHIELPGGQRVSFTGRPGDIWYIFILYAASSYISFGLSFVHSALGLVSIPLSAFCAFIIVRWFFRNLTWDGRMATLEFTGSYWALLGWNLFALVAFISIIGWAWVYAAWGRWLCRNVKGSARQFIFTASGWGYLWRTVTLVIGVVYFFPLPWVLRWYTRWLVSQFALIEA